MPLILSSSLATQHSANRFGSDLAAPSVLLRQGVFRLLQFFFEALLEFAVHGCFLELLGVGVYLKIIVTVLLMLNLREFDGLLLAVKYGYDLRIGGYLIVREPPAADAQVVVALLLYLQEVLLSGYSGI